jgi:hypothetical protein
MTIEQKRASKKLLKKLIIDRFPDYFLDIEFSDNEKGHTVNFQITGKIFDLALQYVNQTDSDPVEASDFYTDNYHLFVSIIMYLKLFEDFELNKVLLEILKYVNLDQSYLDLGLVYIKNGE